MAQAVWSHPPSPPNPKVINSRRHWLPPSCTQSYHHHGPVLVGPKPHQRQPNSQPVGSQSKLINWRHYIHHASHSHCSETPGAQQHLGLHPLICSRIIFKDFLIASVEPGPHLSSTRTLLWALQVLYKDVASLITTLMYFHFLVPPILSCSNFLTIYYRNDN